MNSPVLRMAAYVDNRLLSAATAETFTKPAGYSVCQITADAECWVRRGGTAVEPVGDVVDGTGSILIPANTPRLFDLNGVTPAAALSSFSIISTAGGNVSVEWVA